jgi:hypothetical protein
VSDVVVTVPKRLWSAWLEEGDLPRADGPTEWLGKYEYGFTFAPGVPRPKCFREDRVYVVAHGLLRGYAPLWYIDDIGERFGGRAGSFALVRRGGAVACTISEPVRGFQSWRYRWWEREVEVSFPNWKTEGIS